jgi:hypothetical protein
MSKQKLLYLTITLFTLLLSGLFLRALPFSRAQTTPTVSLTTDQPSYQLGDTITVSVEVDNVENLGGYQFTLGFDPTLVTYEFISDADFLSSTGRTAIPFTPDGEANQITFGAFTLASPNPGASGTGIMATATFTAIANGTLSLSLTNVILSDPSGTQISTTTLSPLEVAITDSAPIASPTPTATGGPTPTPLTTPTPTDIVEPTPTPINSPTPTVTGVSASPTPTVTSEPVSPTPTGTGGPTPTPVPNGTATLTLVSTSPEPLIDTPFSIDLNLTTDNSISGIDVILQYDPRRLRVDSLTDHHLLPQTPLLEDNPGSGLIRFSTLADPGQATTPNGTLLTLNVTPLALGPLEISFDYTQGSKADTNVIAAADGSDILQPPTSLGLEVQDQAFISVELSTPSENQALGHQLTGTLTSDTFTTEVTTNPQGLSDPLLAPPTLIGQLQSFFFKASGFLKAKVDSTLNSGQNLLNFGHLKAGDLNDDGIINTIDLSLLYAAWFQDGATDFNRDGTTNSADHWHLWNNYLLEDAE